jgi:antitoxin component YwqK of YwqJK toxin-antitoxin module
MKHLTIFAAIVLFGTASFALPEKCVEKNAELKKDKASKEIKDGEEYKCYENGKWKSAGFWKDGQREGLWTFYYKNGNKEKEGSYKDGKKEGNWIKWHERRASDQELKRKAQKKGFAVKVGNTAYGSPQAAKRAIVTGISMKEVLPPPKKWEGHYAQSQRQGNWTYWYANAREKKQGVFKDNQEHGKWAGWHINGKKKWEADYVQGKKTGLSIDWHDNGQLKMRGEYVNGQKNGDWFVFHANGKKQRAGLYQDDARQGKWTGWHINGKKKWEADYVQGKKIEKVAGTVRSGEIAFKGALSRKEIQDALSPALEEMKHCYERELKKNPYRKGKITLVWAIDKTGQRGSIKVTEDTLGSKEVTACVLASVSQARFPKPKDGKKAVVAYPLAFSSDADFGDGVDDVTQGNRRPVIIGSLDKKIIKRVVTQNMGQIRGCYEDALTREPGLSGRVTMKWVIDPNGQMAKVKVANTQMQNSTVEDCMKEKIKTWKFPKPKGGGIVIVTYPFLFSFSEDKKQK